MPTTTQHDDLLLAVVPRLSLTSVLSHFGLPQHKQLSDVVKCPGCLQVRLPESVPETTGSADNSDSFMRIIERHGDTGMPSAMHLTAKPAIQSRHRLSTCLHGASELKSRVTLPIGWLVVCRTRCYGCFL